MSLMCTWHTAGGTQPCRVLDVYMAHSGWHTIFSSPGCIHGTQPCRVSNVYMAHSRWHTTLLCPECIHGTQQVAHNLVVSSKFTWHTDSRWHTDNRWHTYLQALSLTFEHLFHRGTKLRMSGSIIHCRSRWPRGLRRGSAAARLLGLRVRISPVAWTSVCCECCVLSGRGLCDELITRPEESYRLWCVVCDLEISRTRRTCTSRAV